MRGIRGAITVEQNTKEAMCHENEIAPEEIGAAIFSATEDLTAAFPAAGARALPDFAFVPLFDARQMDVDASLPMCIRALFLVNTEKEQREIQHVYLRKAIALRPDLIAATR